ncbi:unnamed protein product [Adineta ricciae]|uniref:Protein kinase domain-containing protein n=1 Tax=Adineta ricciae TaxID=249248 RepID=A0A815V4C0_ADIRI|nr:unnamed protein product [Adineta ricciae]CAF1525126.1 unnamed protein product [Adineta ricciae]
MAANLYTQKLQSIIQANSHIRDMVQKNVNEFLSLREALLTNSGIKELTSFRKVLFPLIEGPRIEQLNVRITSDRVHLAFCGENSSGKTAFLHRFLDIGKILPSGDGPVTARITKLTYAPSDQACIRIRRSLRDQTLAEDEIKLAEFFTSEKPNWMGIARSLSKYVKRPENMDDKSEEFAEWARYFVEVHIPSPILALGIDVYDTPGFLLDDAPVLKVILHDLVELIHPTIIFMYANPTTDDATRHCFLAMKTALDDLDTASIFFLSTKADINQMLKFKQGMNMDDFISILAEERSRRYELLLNAPFLANDQLEGLPKSVDECNGFDLFSVNSYIMKPYGPFMNETTIRRIIQFVANNDLTIATRVCKLILPIIDAFFNLLRITGYQTSERLLQLQYDALNWEKTFFEAYTMFTDYGLKTLFTDVFERFLQEEETIVDTLVHSHTPLYLIKRTIRTAVRHQILKPAIRDTIAKFMRYVLEHIASNIDLTRSASFNEILVTALGAQEMSDFATMLLGDNHIKNSATPAIVYMMNTISTPMMQCAQKMLDFDFFIKSEYQNNEEDVKIFVRRYMLHMQRMIEEQRNTMRQAVKLWGDHQEGIIRSLIDVHYQTTSPLLLSNQITLNSLEVYVKHFVVIECRLRAAQDMAKFYDSFPKIHNEIATTTVFCLLTADWNEEKNLIIKKLAQPIADQPYAAYYEAHYHLTVGKVNHQNIVNIRYLYEHQIDNETSELWIIFPPMLPSLETFLQQTSNSIPLQRVLRWMINLTDALIVLHENGFVHRNITLSNLLLTDDDQVMLTDLGNWNEPGDISLHHQPAATAGGMNDDMRSFGVLGGTLSTRIVRDEEIGAIISEFDELLVKCQQATQERPITAHFVYNKLKFILDMF